MHAVRSNPEDISITQKLIDSVNEGALDYGRKEYAILGIAFLVGGCLSVAGAMPMLFFANEDAKVFPNFGIEAYREFNKASGGFNAFIVNATLNEFFFMRFTKTLIDNHLKRALLSKHRINILTRKQIAIEIAKIIYSTVSGVLPYAALAWDAYGWLWLAIVNAVTFAILDKLGVDGIVKAMSDFNKNIINSVLGCFNFCRTSENDEKQPLQIQPLLEEEIRKIEKALLRLEELKKAPNIYWLGYTSLEHILTSLLNYEPRPLSVWQGSGLRVALRGGSGVTLNIASLIAVSGYINATYNIIELVTRGALKVPGNIIATVLGFGPFASLVGVETFKVGQNVFNAVEKTASWLYDCGAYAFTWGKYQREKQIPDFEVQSKKTGQYILDLMKYLGIGVAVVSGYQSTMSPWALIQQFFGGTPVGLPEGVAFTATAVASVAFNTLGLVAIIVALHSYVEEISYYSFEKRRCSKRCEQALSLFKKLVEHGESIDLNNIKIPTVIQ